MEEDWEAESDANSASTFTADGKMGRSRPVPRVYAMGAPRTDMSHCMTRWDGDRRRRAAVWTTCKK